MLSIRFSALLPTVLLTLAASSVALDSRGGATEPLVRAPIEALSTYAAFAGHLGVGGHLERDERGFHASIDAGTARTLDLTVAPKASGPIRVGLANDEGFWIELTDPDATAVEGVVVEGSVVFGAATKATDHVWVVEAGRAEEIRLMRSPTASTHTREKVALGPAVSSIRLREGHIELLDAEGRVRLASESMFAVDAHGVRRDVTVRFDESTKTIESDLDASGLAYPIALDPVWAPATSMAAQRTGHTSTPLSSGKVLVAGGTPNAAGDPISTAEVYDPTTNTWALTSPMVSVRNGHIAMALVSGKVLVATGRKAATLVGTTAELYDPVSNSFATTGSLTEGRFGAAAALLTGGKVLVVGGAGDGTTILSSVEIYDPGAGTWSAAAPLAAKRTFHTATTLTSGKVLVAGGFEPISNAELYDPTTNTWSAVPFMASARGGHTATLLPSGKVLIVGGGVPSSSSALKSAELYDPLTNTWSAAGTPLYARIFHASILLASGKVLVSGGSNFGSALSTSELYDPATNGWTTVSNLVAGRSNHGGAVIPGGALVTGGKSTGGVVLSSAEVYAPAPVSTACTTPGECASGFCVDGRCCDRACTGQCEACNVAAGPPGKCTAVTGVPIGTRPRCDTTNPDICKRSSCDGKDATKCAGFVTGTSCGAGTCSADGLSTTGARTCDGTGTCSAATSTPVSCSPYKCNAGVCRTSCTTTADCTVGLCNAGRCGSTTGCSADGVTLINPDGTSKDCSPFICRSGRCLTSCVSDNDCASRVCDLYDSHLCFTPQQQSSGCGCEVGRSLPLELAPIGMLGVLAFFVRKRRRTTRR